MKRIVIAVVLAALAVGLTACSPLVNKAREAGHKVVDKVSGELDKAAQKVDGDISEFVSEHVPGAE